MKAFDASVLRGLARLDVQQLDLPRVRRDYGLCVYAYVVMPEHVHLLLNEPDRGSLGQAIKSLKQGVARRLALRAEDSFWVPRSRVFCEGGNHRRRNWGL